MLRITREYIRHAAVEEGFQGVWKLWSRLNTRISNFPPPLPPPSVKAINVIIDFRAGKGRGCCIYSLAAPSRQSTDNSFKNPDEPREPFLGGLKRGAAADKAAGTRGPAGA